MSTVTLKYGDNPNEVKWTDIIDAAYHNLGSKAGKVVVHFAIDMKEAMGYVGKRSLDVANGLIVDHALELDIYQAYPPDDIEYLEDLVFFRAFCFDTVDLKKIENSIHEIFYPGAASYVWVNGSLCGGLCYPQEESSDEDYPPVKEVLSDYVCYRPTN
jgi:hypothetical protein